MKSASNPESGTILYAYDPNGNLTSKTDARSITTTYVYDALNRVTERSYDDNATLPVYYTYDKLSHAMGQLIKVTTGSGSTPFSVSENTEFDAFGRVKKSKQSTDGTVYNEMEYTYNLSGALIEEKYPSGRLVRNVLDNNGDLMQVQSKKANETLRNYANGFTYTAAGAVSAMRLGNGKWESTTFNSRLQPIRIGLGGSASDQSLLKLEYTYGVVENNQLNTAKNNGNIQSQTITVQRSNQNPLVLNQSYVYDDLNRLKSAEETTGGSSAWKQTYSFDRYGNRRFDQANTSFPASFANTTVSNPAINASDNRFAGGQGYTYDPSGNMLTDAEGRSFQYDAENKQKEVKNASNQSIGLYYFDGDGRRVKKVTATETVIFVYDAGGKLVAEYSTNPSESPQVQYLTNDHLGTPRINTNENGAVVSRTDYMPYGEEIIGLGGRSTTDKYVGDDVRQGFTGYINDEETGLDYAQARMYKKELGRFTAADPAMVSASIQNPQTWNRYAYVLNNPHLYTDPFGLWAIDRDAEKSVVYEEYKDEDGKTRRRVKSVAVILKMEKGDDVKTLAKQLNIKEKEAAKILALADKDGNIQLSKAGGNIGSVFKAIESRIKKHYEDKLENPSRGDDQGFDCSKTTAVLGGFNLVGGGSEAQFSGANGLDTEYVGKGAFNPTVNVAEKDLKAGDMVRFAPDGEVAAHWATFLMFNSSGEPFVFSKSGSAGPNEFVRAKDLERGTYGKVSPNSRNRAAGTGFYRKVR